MSKATPSFSTAAFSKALTGEDELGVIIRSHIYIEAEVDKCLKRLLKDADQLGNELEYDMKVRLALAAGLRADLKSPLNALGRLRNKFAHKLDMSLSPEDADNFFATLSKTERDAVDKSLPHGASSHKELAPKDRMVLYVLTIWGALISEPEPKMKSLFS